MPEENEKPPWAMPEPVFRSSHGKTLRGDAAAGDEARTGVGDNETPGISMVDKNIADETRDSSGDSAGVKHGRGGKLQVSMTLIFLIFFGVLLVVLGIGYYMWTHTGSSTLP